MGQKHVVSRDRTYVRTQTRPGWMQGCPSRVREVGGKTVQRAAPREFQLYYIGKGESLEGFNYVN